VIAVGFETVMVSSRNAVAVLVALTSKGR